MKKLWNKAVNLYKATDKKTLVYVVASLVGLYLIFGVIK